MAPLPWRFAALVSLLAAFAGALALRLRRALRRHRSRLDELHDRLRQASELAEARQRYVAQLGHEARNLVANITGTLALADRAPDPLALRRVVQALRANARGLQDLLDASLDAAQLDAGRFAVRPVCVDLPRLLDDLSAEVAPLTRGGAVLVGIEGELAIATCWQLDGVRLAQIVRNLVGNALRHAPGGDVRVQARVLPDPNPTGWRLCLHVIDRGPGMDPEQQQRLFTDFGRVAEVAGGVGLGLAVSRRLARAMGGDLRVCSAAGLGTTFSLWLPVQTPSSHISVTEAPAPGTAS